MNTFILFFIVSACAVAIVASQNPDGPPDVGMGGGDGGQMRRMKRDANDNQKEVEDKIEQFKEGAQSVIDRMVEEYDKLKRMVMEGVENMKGKASKGHEDKEQE